MTLKTRDSFPDILRCFALFGIAMVNIQYFSISTFNGAESLDLTKPENGSVAFIVWALFQAKFYLLFSFLFGYSAHYVIKSEKANRRRWIGRSIGLLILGAIHLTFFFHGDILFLYGALGLLLLAFYFRKEKTLKVWAWVIYLFTALGFVSISAFAYLGEFFLASKGKTLPADIFVDVLDRALLSGNFLETAMARVELWIVFAPGLLPSGATGAGSLHGWSFGGPERRPGREPVANGHEALCGLGFDPRTGTPTPWCLPTPHFGKLGELWPEPLSSWAIAELPDRSADVSGFGWRTLAIEPEI